MAWNQHLTPGSGNAAPPPSWWRDGSPGCKVNAAHFVKVKDNPEFTVALGVQEYTM